MICVSCEVPISVAGGGVSLSDEIWRCDDCQSAARTEPLEDRQPKQTVELLTTRTRRGSGVPRMQRLAARHFFEDRERIQARLEQKIATFEQEARLEIAAEMAAELEAITADEAR